MAQEQGQGLMTLTYKCAMCGGTYESDRDDEEALSEMRSFFGGIRKEECAVVCEDCFRKMHPAEHPEKVEDAVAKTLRKRMESPELFGK